MNPPNLESITSAENISLILQGSLIKIWGKVLIYDWTYKQPNRDYYFVNIDESNLFCKTTFNIKILDFLGIRSRMFLLFWDWTLPMINNWCRDLCKYQNTKIFTKITHKGRDFRDDCTKFVFPRSLGTFQS